MTYDEMRVQIPHYDKLIQEETNYSRKLGYIDQQIALLNEYIAFLKKGRRIRIVLCVLLSLLAFMGLVIFLPGIIIRNIKLTRARNKLVYYMKMKTELEPIDV